MAALPLVKKVGCALGVSLLILIMSDLVGVMVSLILDVVPLRGKSGALFYSVWFVLGVFCGFLSFDRAGRLIAGDGEGDWSTRPDAARTGWLVIFSATGLYSAICAVSQFLLWRSSAEPSYFVPDNEVLTILFSVSVVGSMVVANTVLLPARQG